MITDNETSVLNNFKYNRVDERTEKIETLLLQQRVRDLDILDNLDIIEEKAIDIEGVLEEMYTLNIVDAQYVSMISELCKINLEQLYKYLDGIMANRKNK